MRSIIAILIMLFMIIQYQLWFTTGGVLSVCHLNKSIDYQTLKNRKLADRNTILIEDIEDLKHGTKAIEEHARSDLGMIKNGEVFYQMIK